MQSPPSSDLPPLSPVLAPLTTEEKRARQRLHVKRTYYRKLNLLQTLRDQVHELEAEYDQLRAEQHLDEARVVLADAPAYYSVVGEDAKTRYHQLSELKARLRKENEELQVALATYQRFTKTMENLSYEGEFGTDDEEEEEMNLRGTCLGYTLPTIVVPTLRAPISVDVCRNIYRRTFEEMSHFRRSDEYVSTGVSIFGWRDKRMREDNSVKFSLKKTFFDITPFALALRSWDFLSSAQHMPLVYSASLNVRVFTLQHVDEDNVVLFRTISRDDCLVLVKMPFLISRFEIPGGYAIILCPIDKDLLVPIENSPGICEEWLDSYIWVTFERVGEHGQHCLFDFGGEVRGTPVINSDAWMLELLFIALRWEHHVVGPIFSLGGGELC